jgi:hypothetical protein
MAPMTGKKGSQLEVVHTGSRPLPQLQSHLGGKPRHGAPIEHANAEIQSASARLLEPLAMLWVQLALTEGQGRDFALVMARRDAANRRAEPGVRLVHPHPQQVE